MPTVTGDRFQGVSITLDTGEIDNELTLMRARLRRLSPLLRDYVAYAGLRAAGGVVRNQGKRKNFVFRDSRGWTRRSFRIINDRARLRIRVAYGGQGRSKVKGEGAYQATLLEFGTKFAPAFPTLKTAYEVSRGRQRAAAFKAMQQTFNRLKVQAGAGIGTDLRIFIRQRERAEEYS